MAVLNCNFIIKPQVVASSNDSSPSPSPSPKSQLKPNKQPPGKQIYRKLKKKKQQQQQQPTVFEIERAIGAGVFRDRDPSSEGEEEKAGLLDNILRNTVGKNEGDVEKKLRETGEWLISRTENTSRSAGKLSCLILNFLSAVSSMLNRIRNGRKANTGDYVFMGDTTMAVCICCCFWDAAPPLPFPIS